MKIDNEEYSPVDTARSVLKRIVKGWELYDDDGSWRWYSETKPGFDDELPTSEEIAFIQQIKADLDG